MLEQPQALTPAAYVAFATTPAPGWPPCGLTLGSAGEVLIGVAAPNPFAVLGPAAWISPGVLAWTFVPLPADLSLLGAKLYAQGLFADLSGAVPAEPLRLTNALELTLGI